MLKSSFFLFFLLIIGISSIYGAQVKITADVFDDYTDFTYEIDFDKSDNKNSFAFEKPEGSWVKSAKIGEIDLIIKKVGGFFIFESKNAANNTAIIKFRSHSTSANLLETNSYLNYINFNIEIQKLEYTTNFKSNFGKVNKILPRDYEELSELSFSWKLHNPRKDTFILVEFIDEKNLNFIERNSTQIIIGSLFLILALLLFFNKKIIFKILKKNKEEENIENKKNTNNNQNENNKSNSNSENKKEDNLIKNKDESEKLKPENNNKDEEAETIDEHKGENFDEIIEKYLTENEKDIVLLIREIDGISQNDILNNIPTLSKSNLSKIITKMDSKRFLKKIKVGKINKIYLGEKLKDK